MATLTDALRVYRYNRSTGLLTGLNAVLREYKRRGCRFTPKVLERIVFGDHQEWLRHHKYVNHRTLLREVSRKLKSYWPLRRTFATFEDLYESVRKDTEPICGIGHLTIYDIALRIGFLYDEPLLPKEYVYIQAGALKGIVNLSSDPLYSHLFPPRAWAAGAYPASDFTAAFGPMESMFIEDFLCVFHKELSRLSGYTIKQLQ